MMCWRTVLTGLFLMFCSLSGHAAPAPAGDARQLWQLIDYVAVDYGGAVANGAVISSGEYGEMLDFTDNAARQARRLPPTPASNRLAAAIADLRAAVLWKADAAEVRRLANLANGILLAAYPIPVAPKIVPSLPLGAALYASQCVTCHGVHGGGDGPLAATLDPRPVAFTDRNRAASRSLMALYQVVTQGVAGTAMPAFATLSDDERWALAFYVGTLSHDAQERERGRQLLATDPAVKKLFPDLAALTTMTELTAAQTMPRAAARDAMAWLRSHPGVVDAGKPAGLALARVRLQGSLDALHAGDRAGATTLALAAYLDGFEPIEPVVGARDPALLTAVESAMLAYRAAVASGTTAEADAVAGQLATLFARVDAAVGHAQADPASTYVGALTILLREGLEALLIIIGMVAFLRKAGRPDVLRQVHAGWISALAAGAMTWLAATYLVTISGASREVSEGVGSLFAALVLLSVGWWMHQKSSAGRWQAYLDEKLAGAMGRGSGWGLFMLAFIAVYREVFETVLFYAALAADGNGAALLGGCATAAALLALIAWGLLRTSARLPLGTFFSVTSVLVAVLAVVLTGKGTAALQEAGWLAATPVAAPRLDVLGVFPTVQTLTAQVIVLALVLGGYGLNLYNARRTMAGRAAA